MVIRTFTKPIFLLVCFCLAISCTGCQKSPPLSPMAAIQQKLSDMEGYTCLATLTRTSNKTLAVYETKQDFKSDGSYRIEMLSPESVAGNYTVCDGSRVCQYNPRLPDAVVYDVAPAQQRNELFLGQFLKNYMQSEGVAVESAALDESRCTVLEAIIPGNDTAMASEKLWVDNDTLLPVRLIIYDADGNERYRLDYTAFTYNPHFDENLFRLPA